MERSISAMQHALFLGESRLHSLVLLPLINALLVLRESFKEATPAASRLVA